MEYRKISAWNGISPTERNTALEAFYHPPFIPIGGVMATMSFDTTSTNSPLRQLFEEMVRREASEFGRIIMGNLRLLLNSAPYISREFRTWLKADYQHTRRLGFYIEEDWFGAPWIDLKGKDGIFSDDFVYVKHIEVPTHIAVWGLRDAAEAENRDRISGDLAYKALKRSPPAEIALVNWRKKLINDGYIDLEEY